MHSKPLKSFGTLDCILLFLMMLKPSDHCHISLYICIILKCRNGSMYQLVCSNIYKHLCKNREGERRFVYLCIVCLW